MMSEMCLDYWRKNSTNSLKETFETYSKLFREQPEKVDDRKRQYLQEIREVLLERRVSVE